jgi:cytochrome c oxidase cbb3-type subunit 3
MENAWAISEGKRLFSAFNCSGCHGNGGGAIGPPLMDHRWIYGYAPDNVHESIVEGRPNGMPAFRGRLTEQQAWQLTAYVLSLSGLVPKDAAGGRSDHMLAKPSEQSITEASPVWTGATP